MPGAILQGRGGFATLDSSAAIMKVWPAAYPPWMRRG